MSCSENDWNIDNNIIKWISGSRVLSREVIAQINRMGQNRSQTILNLYKMDI